MSDRYVYIWKGPPRHLQYYGPVQTGDDVSQVPQDILLELIDDNLVVKKLVTQSKPGGD